MEVVFYPTQGKKTVSLGKKKKSGLVDKLLIFVNF